MTELLLKGYQKKAIKDFVTRDINCVFMGYGSGKTRTAISCTTWHQDDRNFPMTGIVFCRGHNVLTWEVELAKWADHITVYSGEKDQGINNFLEDHRDNCVPRHAVLIVPHHRIASLHERLHHIITSRTPAALMMDESTKIKNSKTKTFKSARSLADVARKHSTRMICLTGNPTPERPEEIWTQFQFAYGDKNPFGNSEYAFLHNWFIKHDYGYALRLERITEFGAVVAQYSSQLSREDREELRKEIGVYPPVYSTEYYTVTTKQKKWLEHLYENWSLPLNPNDESEGEEWYSYTMSLAMKAQQICSEFYYTGEEKKVVSIQPVLKDGYGVKASLLKSILEQLIEEKSSRRVIVWHRFRAELPGISQAIEKADLTFVVGPRREALMDFTLEDGPQVIIMPTAVTEGLNELVRADSTIFYSNEYSQERRDQAEARTRRPGQQSDTLNFIDLAAPHMMDLEIVTALQGKNLTPERLNTIINHYASKCPHEEQQA